MGEKCEQATLGVRALARPPSDFALAADRFQQNVEASRQRRFDVLLKSIGRQGEVTGRARESAHSQGRLLTFFAHAANERKEDKPLQARIRTAARDVASLTDHV